MLIGKKKTHIEAHMSTLPRQGNLYIDLGTIKSPLSRDFYQASYGIEGSLEKEAGFRRKPAQYL